MTTTNHTRTKLPLERPSWTRKFEIASPEAGTYTLYITVGLYPDTRKPGEIFFRGGKLGSDLMAMLDSWAEQISRRLQMDEPIAKLVEEFDTHGRQFNPHGETFTEFGRVKSPYALAVRYAEMLERRETTCGAQYLKGNPLFVCGLSKGHEPPCVTRSEYVVKGSP